MKSLYIILTRTESAVSRIVHLMTADMYTHVSISFDASFSVIYSSARKNGRTMFPAGPCREYLNRGFYMREGRTPCAVYELIVPDEVYDAAFKEVKFFMDNQDSYSFNGLGLISCRFGIPLHRKRHFFCSQFVGEILLRSGAAILPKDTALMRPSDYMLLPELNCLFQGDIGDIHSLRRKAYN